VKLDIEENDLYKRYTATELKQLQDVDIYFKKILDGNLVV